MAILLTLKGPDAGRHFPLEAAATVLGRHGDSDICLESQSVSRHHARIVRQDSSFLVEDLRSSNGTLVNGKRIKEPVPLTEKDTLQIGPYLFALRPDIAPAPGDDDLIIREEVNATLSNTSLHGANATQKLQTVLEIAQLLAGTLDMDTVLDKLLGHLMVLFPQTDRGLVLLCDGDKLVVRAQRARGAEDATTYSYSRTIVRKVLEDGVGIISDDVRTDQRFKTSSTLVSLKVRSLLCVPLIAPDAKRLGVLQLDHYRMGRTFQLEDLQLLTVVGMQVAVVLENAALHQEILREERLRRELSLAREIQEGFLPAEFPRPEEVGYELYARLQPAREVAGDLYDFLTLPDGRLAFFVGDVSGKGMPAALFMVAVRTLGRHLASAGGSPAATLGQLNAALAADNPSGMFVTLAHGIYEPATGRVVLSSGGHPLPLLRHADGSVETVALPTGRLLGFEGGNLRLEDTALVLAPGETLIFYTDGFTEAQAPEGENMFGEDRLREALGGPRTAVSLEACADYARAAVERFSGRTELQDDLTLFLLRRLPAP
jgi:serine phosphatase RsbU (regulator of sigma subunit)